MYWDLTELIFFLILAKKIQKSEDERCEKSYGGYFFKFWSRKKIAICKIETCS